MEKTNFGEGPTEETRIEKGAEIEVEKTIVEESVAIAKEKRA